MPTKNILVLDDLKSKIHSIRGLQVMLDRDLAVLYGIQTRALKQAVNRNKKRFPPDFMFILNESEIDLLVSQNVIPSKKHIGGALPYAFTEHGVANLASILTSDRAIEMNIQIMRAFVAMRRFILSNAQIFHRLDAVERKQVEHDMRFEQVFEAIESKDSLPKQGIFFEGQIFDAYTFASDVVRSAKKSIILVDNYIDDYKVYHFGASLKDLGKKWMAFSKFDKEALKILERLE